MLFVDYGNEGVASDIRVLPDELRDLSACSVQCSLMWSEHDDGLATILRESSDPLFFRVIDQLAGAKIVRVWTDEAHVNEVSMAETK